MSSEQTFTIRKTFLLPLGLLLALNVALFVVCLAQGESRAKVGLLGLIIVPVGILFVESAFRRTVIDGEGITVRKFMRQRMLRFAELTALDTVMVRKRVFLTLSAGDDFLILSNAYADFPGLVQALLARVPASAVSEETRTMAAAPPLKSTDIVSCWMAVLLLAFILYSQLAAR